MTNKKVVIIGGGIGGLATAALLAKAGLQVEVYERHAQAGGRAGKLTTHGFTFDTGPSWLLMPEVFDHFYQLLGTDIHAQLDLKRLTPAYKVMFEDAHQKPVTIYGDIEKDSKTFDAIEEGAGSKLKQYIDTAEDTYRKAIDSYLYTNFTPLTTMLHPDIIKSGPKMLRFATQSIHSYIGRFVKSPALQQILAYPMVFLGTSPYNAPALYHLMSYMDFKDGVFYPMGGVYKIIESIVQLCNHNGVTIHTNSPVKNIITAHGTATGITLDDGTKIDADIVISNADLHYTETVLLPEHAQTYPEKYWVKKQASPGAILMYLGVKGGLPEFEHHNLIFTKDWRKNFAEIFTQKTWPHPASMYICRSSATDSSVAPNGHENIFVLVPVMADSSMDKTETAKRAEQYLDQLIEMSGVHDLRERIVYKKFVGPADFANDLHAWRGSALGLSHTLRQSALWRPKNKSKKVDNLYYVGGNTLPGIGLPMCLIGAELIYKHLANDTSFSPITALKPLTLDDK